MVIAIDIDENLIDNTIDSLFGIISTIIQQFGKSFLDIAGSLIGGTFSNNIGILIITLTIGATAYMVMRKI